LAITDNNDNAVVIFNEGHIRTKNFNSESQAVTSGGESLYDLALVDNNNNALVIFDEGHIKTKNFDSRSIINNNPLKNLRLSILGDSISTFNGKLVPNDLGLYSYYPNGDV